MKCYQKDYPRPQLVRKNWMNLNGEWDFAFDEKNLGEKEKWQEQFPDQHKIQVPFTYETPASGIGRQERCDRVWYRKKICISKQQAKRYLLHFEGCDFETRVWVNGQFSGSHKGGYSRFSLTGKMRSASAPRIPLIPVSPGENRDGEKRISPAGMCRQRESGRPSGWKKSRSCM